MTCDCQRLTFYSAKLVICRKPHKCCECNDTIPLKAVAEKANGKWGEIVQTLYTCRECWMLREYLKRLYPNIVCGHCELKKALWDFAYTSADIQKEAIQIKGRHCVIACKVPWLERKQGKFRLVPSFL